MKHPAAVLALAVVVLAGCSSTEERWVKPGATAADFNRASYQCAREATSTARRAAIEGGSGFYPEGAALRKHLYRACLANRGYERAETEPDSGWKGVD
jgi:hypothetical protein